MKKHFIYSYIMNFLCHSTTSRPETVAEGVSFHVGSQCTNAQNYVQALHLAAGIFAEAKLRGFDPKLLDIGGGFPAHYYPGTEEAHTNPTRQRGECLRALAGASG